MASLTRRFIVRDFPLKPPFLFFSLPTTLLLAGDRVRSFASSPQAWDQTASREFVSDQADFF